MQRGLQWAVSFETHDITQKTRWLLAVSVHLHENCARRMERNGRKRKRNHHRWWLNYIHYFYRSEILPFCFNTPTVQQINAFVCVWFFSFRSLILIFIRCKEADRLVIAQKARHSNKSSTDKSHILQLLIARPPYVNCVPHEQRIDFIAHNFSSTRNSIWSRETGPARQMLTQSAMST